MNIGVLQAYTYFFITILLVFLLYMYMHHLYTAKKKTGKDYEEYGNLALDDRLSDKPIEQNSSVKTIS